MELLQQHSNLSALLSFRKRAKRNQCGIAKRNIAVNFGIGLLLQLCFSKLWWWWENLPW